MGIGTLPIPAIQTGLVATSQAASIALDWDTSPDPAVSRYNVYRSATSGGPYELRAAAVADSD